MYGLKKGANGRYAVCPGSRGRFQKIRASCFGTKGPGPARQIADVIDRIPHGKYVEPFLGHGNVYRARRRPAAKEVVNDKDCRQVGITKVLTCQVNDKTKCERLKKARVTCRRDWKAVVRAHCNDKQALCYLDPPFMSAKDVSKSDGHLTFKDKTGVHPAEMRRLTERMAGAVLISYNDNPEAKRILCRRPFRCKTITKNLMGRNYAEILAVKTARR